jgi:hypothetical protein
MRWRHTLALQTWAEALRDPVLQKRARALYLETLDRIGELAGRWRDEGYIPPNADTNAVAATLFFAHARSDRDAPQCLRRTG